MTEEVKRKTVQRTRKRVYETVETAAVPEMGAEDAPVLVGKPVLMSLGGNVEVTEQATSPTVDQEADKAAEAVAVVKRFTLYAAGVGVVPIPLLDMVTMLALQMFMVRKLARLYAVPYSEQRSKAAVAGLIGGFDAGYLGGCALKMVPLFGIFSFVAMPTLNAAISYAVGKVFIQHFESGGTFLDFDPQKVRAYFEDQFREGKLKRL